MTIRIIKTALTEIRDLRGSFLRENAMQFVYNKCHEYGWADDWLILADGEVAGYGSVWGSGKREDRDAVFEFYLSGPFRNAASRIFGEFLHASGASLIECQSNDPLLSSMLYEYAHHIFAEAILFEDHFQSHLAIPGLVFAKGPYAAGNPADVGGYYLEKDGETVATGGFMLNYNFPYADIYMESMEAFRQQGYGSLMVQELKKEIYGMGRVPAARCNIDNQASKATLLKAGFRVCGAILKGIVKHT